MSIVMLPVGKSVPFVGKLPFIDLEIPFVAPNGRGLLDTPFRHVSMTVLAPGTIDLCQNSAPHAATYPPRHSGRYV